jgi:ATP sulfurylase
MDCEQIAHGTYSPLTSFMDRQTLESVLGENRLPDGTIWTMPILLQVSAEDAAGFGKGERIALKSETGTIHAVLDISEIYAADPEDMAEGWFGTVSKNHPGVARIMSEGGYCIGGAITLIERLLSPYRHYELTPAQTRFVFTRKGWSRVVGFHTRNPVHRGHEAIQLAALERTGADGLYINPVVGPKKKGDFLPEPIMKCYQAMLEFRCYPPNKVVLGSFATYSRYAGPREAVFTALARKNMGCSHFIIGRDHTGVGDFYGPEANQNLFETLGDIGIEPVVFDTVGYDPAADRYGPVDGSDRFLEISGTRIRKALQSGEKLPEWIMRDVVQDVLRREISEKRGLFVE